MAGAAPGKGKLKPKQKGFTGTEGECWLPGEWAAAAAALVPSEQAWKEEVAEPAK